MADYNNDRNRTQQSSNRKWDNDDIRNYRNQYSEKQRRGSDGGYGQSRGDYDNNSNSGGNRGDSDWNNDRGMYGNSAGARGGSNYRGREDDWNRGSSEPVYGNERYSGDRNRNEDRDWWDRTKDEVSSWFGDDDAQRRRRMDENRGQHKGKGPKGYARSDDRIKEDVNDRLSDDSEIDASEIDVSVTSCEVMLTGTVNSRWEKRHAEDIAESVSGVKNVENRLKVTSNTNTGAGGTEANSLGSTYRANTFQTSKS